MNVLVLDAVGTLIYPDPPVAAAYRTAAQGVGVDVPVAEIRRRFSAGFRRQRATDCQCEQGRWCVDCSEESERQRWRAIVSDVFPEAAASREQLFETLWRHFADPKHWRMYDDAAALLQWTARSQIPVVIASNFDHRLVRILHGMAGLKAVRAVFHSASVGRAKPCQLFFRRLEQALDTRPEQMLMIGDDPQNDYQAPRQNGWQACLLRRGDHVAPLGPASSGVRPVHAIGCLSEIAQQWPNIAT